MACRPTTKAISIIKRNFGCRAGPWLAGLLRRFIERPHLSIKRNFGCRAGPWLAGLTPLKGHIL